MAEITLVRQEWVAVARELETTYGASAPAGLRERIAALLDHVESGWADEGCTLTLDPAAADIVHAIVRRGRGLANDPDLTRAQAEGIAEAERIVRGHRAGGDGERS
jgi:hypothetical protein